MDHMDLPTFDFVNDDERRFTAEYDPSDESVTFYDASYDHFPYPGQKTYSYYASTLLAHRGTLRLHTEIPEWTLSETNVLDVQAWIAKLESQTY